MLAQRCRTLHHPPLRNHPRSKKRQAQRRHVPHANLRRTHHRHALAKAESSRRTLPRPHKKRRNLPGTCGDGAPPRPSRAKPNSRSRRHNGPLIRRRNASPRRPSLRQDGRSRSHRHRPGANVLRHSPRSARRRRIHHRRIPPPEAGRASEVRDRRSGSSRQCRDHPRRLRQSRRTPHRRPLRRSHRLLLAGRRVPRFPRHLRDPPKRSDLRDNSSRQAPARRCLDGQSSRTHLSPADEANHPRASGHQPAHRRRVPQPDASLHPQVLSRTSPQSNERHLVVGPSHVHQVHHRGR